MAWTRGKVGSSIGHSTAGKRREGGRFSQSAHASVAATEREQGTLAVRPSFPTTSGRTLSQDGPPLWGKGIVRLRAQHARRFPRGSSAMLLLLRKSSIINRVFVALVVMACLLAAVGASGAWWLQAQGEQASQLAREARAVEGGAAKKIADSADLLAAGSAGAAVTVAVATFVCTLLGIAAAAVMRASIKYPVEALVDSAAKLAAGDFVSKIESPGRDELSWLCHELNMMRKRIRDSIKVVLEAAAGVRMTSHELAQGNSDLSSRTEAQAASLQQTSSSMTQLADKVKENASNAKQASNIVHETTEMATRGGSV